MAAVDPADSLARAEQAQREGRVQMLVEEIEEVHAAMTACLRVSEREFNAARQRGKGAQDDEEAWAEAAQIIRKTRSKVNSLLCRERNVLSLYAAECGVHVRLAGGDRQVTLSDKIQVLELKTPKQTQTQTKDALKTMPTQLQPLQTQTHTQESPSEIMAQTELHRHIDSARRQGRVPWEVRVLERIALKLKAKRHEALGAGQSVLRIDADIAKIEQELSAISNSSGPAARKSLSPDHSGASSSFQMTTTSTTTTTVPTTNQKHSKISSHRNTTSSTSKSSARGPTPASEESLHWDTPVAPSVAKHQRSGLTPPFVTQHLDWSISPVQEVGDARIVAREFDAMISKIAAGQTPAKPSADSARRRNDDQTDILDLISTSSPSYAREQQRLARQLFE
ncbi:Hypothetical Protein FCC1311_033812 [Hondaea fermentalgiana]|uniref:Uncharacterized protein n=1 Tax=Hondaea fermentalgiana TaxID=2315210 RepID=A0A2R5GBS6_9STRA|nr:Hypothetical Protein FCC1311_033812 [Hondaea fermentalgiana]|eukprot:GBG27158.1 Hypothetical Protein FCC1311_033812 [Hondaea fermentalgiana]